MHIITCTNELVDKSISKYSLDQEDLKNAVERRVADILSFMPEGEKQIFSFDYKSYLVNIEFVKGNFCEVYITDIKRRLGGNSFFKIYEGVGSAAEHEPSLENFDFLIKKRNAKYLNKGKYTLTSHFNDIVFPWYEITEDKWFIEGDEELIEELGKDKLFNIIEDNKDSISFEVLDDRICFDEEDDCVKSIELLSRLVCLA